MLNKAELLRENFLKKFNLEKETAENIIHAIQSIDLEKKLLLETLEAKAIYDTDKLDSSGAVGITRDFIFCWTFWSARFILEMKKN